MCFFAYDYYHFYVNLLQCVFYPSYDKYMRGTVKIVSGQSKRATEKMEHTTADLNPLAYILSCELELPKPTHLLPTHSVSQYIIFPLYSPSNRNTTPRPLPLVHGFFPYHFSYNSPAPSDAFSSHIQYIISSNAEPFIPIAPRGPSLVLHPLNHHTVFRSFLLLLLPLYPPYSSHTSPPPHHYSHHISIVFSHPISSPPVPLPITSAPFPPTPLSSQSLSSISQPFLLPFPLLLSCSSSPSASLLPHSLLPIPARRPKQREYQERSRIRERGVE